MIEEDTIKLLRECNSGIKMGVSSIDDVLPKVKARNCGALWKKAAKPTASWGMKPTPCWPGMGTREKNPALLPRGCPG